GVGPLLGDVPHARQAAALLLALHGPRPSRVSGAGPLRAHDPRLPRRLRPRARTLPRGAAGGDQRRRALGPRVGAAASVLLRDELARGRRVPGAPAGRRDAAWPRGGGRRREGARAAAEAQRPRLAAAPRAAGAEGRRAAVALVVRQDRRAHRLEPDARLLP